LLPVAILDFVRACVCVFGGGHLNHSVARSGKERQKDDSWTNRFQIFVDWTDINAFSSMFPEVSKYWLTFFLKGSFALQVS